MTTRSGWLADAAGRRLVADGQRGSSTATVFGADQHRVAQRAEPVGVAAGRRAGDPAAGAVGGGAAAVEGGGELPGDERAAVVDGEGPDPVERPGLVDQQALLDLDAGRAQGVGAPGGDRVGVGLGEDHAAYAGLDQGAARRDRCGRCGCTARG